MTNNERCAAVLDVAYEVMEEMLHLPSGTRITRVSDSGIATYALLCVRKRA